MRDLVLAVPSDCIASNMKDENAHALDQMAKVLQADTRPSEQVEFTALVRVGGGRPSI